MRTIKVILIAAGLAYAAASGAAESGKAAGPAASKDDRVCFAEKTTGSHLRRRICMTREEQERRRTEDKQALERMRHSSNRGLANKDPSF
jgi:hypothetical protein